MGTFQRSGTFVDRQKFLEGVKQKLEKLLGGAGQGMTATWEKQGSDDVGRLADGRFVFGRLDQTTLF